MSSTPPFVAQERPDACAVACLRMILAHRGVRVSEEEFSSCARPCSCLFFFSCLFVSFVVHPAFVSLRGTPCHFRLKKTAEVLRARFMKTNSHKKHKKPQKEEDHSVT